MCCLLLQLANLNNRLMLRLLLMYMIMSNDKHLRIKYSFSSLLSVGADRHRITSYRKNQVGALYQPNCVQPADCPFDNAFCNKGHRKCRCKKDFIQVGSFVNKSYISHQAMTCVAVARLNERCISDHQCIADYSDCQLVSHRVGNINQTMHVCKCSGTHEQADDTSEIVLNGNTYHIKPSCSYSRHHNSSWLTTLIIVSLVVIFILIGTFVAIVRYQRWRNPPFPATVTAIASGQGMPGHHAANRLAISGSPPPMGSVEAEFQNDFISVFEMHHLEPLPDKNVHAFMMK